MYSEITNREEMIRKVTTKERIIAIRLIDSCIRHSVFAHKIGIEYSLDSNIQETEQIKYIRERGRVDAGKIS